MLRAGVVVALTAASALVAKGAWAEEGVRVVRQERREAGAATEAGPTAVVTWIGPDRIRRDEGAGRSLIVRLDGGGAFVLDHATRVWRDVPAAGGPGALGGGRPGALPALSVTDTGETRTIGGRICRGYRLASRARLGNAAPPLLREIEVWASEEAGATPGARALAALLGIPLAPRDAVEGELPRVRGLPVLIRERTSLLGRTEERETVLVSVEERPAPAGLWDVPDGYTRLIPPAAAP